PGILVAHSADIRVAGMVAFGVAAVSMIGSGLTPISFVLLPVAARLLAAGKVRQLRSEVVDVVGITLAATLVLVVVLEVFAVPIAILVSSPQRPAVALVISFGYIVMALFSFRLSRANRLMLAYVGLVAAWMTISWLRSTYLLHLNSEQLSYGTQKFEYFVFVVLPMAAAVAIIVEQVEDVWPI